jgi:hypothetical protein
MKKSTSLAAALACALAAALSVIMIAACGCATPGAITPGTPAVTNFVYSVAPATPALPAVTNTIYVTVPATPTTVQVTNTVFVISPAVPAAPAVTNIVQQIIPAVPPGQTYVPNALVTQYAGYAQQAAPLIPAPYGSILTGILALTTLITGYVAQRANASATAAHATASTLAAAVVNNPQAQAAAMAIAANNGTTPGVATKLAAANSPT